MFSEDAGVGALQGAGEEGHREGQGGPEWPLIRLQRIYNFLLFHAILYLVLNIIGLYYALLYYFWD